MFGFRKFRHVGLRRRRVAGSTRLYKVNVCLKLLMAGLLLFCSFGSR